MEDLSSKVLRRVQGDHGQACPRDLLDHFILFGSRFTVALLLSITDAADDDDVAAG